MSNGKLSGLTLDVTEPEDLRPELVAFARWLLSDERTLEVWGLAGVRSARVECVADKTQSLELDSGDWCLVRISGLPTIPGWNGIIRFRRNGQGQEA